MKEDKKEGLRYNSGKTRIDLFPADVIKHVSNVLTKGADKYEDHNWEHGMAWSSVLASMKRHLSSFEMGDDFDKESGLPHIDHVLCNAVFLSRYIRSHPEHDDRFLPYIMNHKKVALDIDGVLADFATPFCKHIGINGSGNSSWYMSYKARDGAMWRKLNKNKKFWVGLKPLISPESLSFEPYAYVTSRSIPIEWTEEWLEANGFPCNTVHVIPSNGGEHGSKVDKIKEIGADIFVDDHYQHFIDLNKAGIKCYLQDSYYNKRWDVGSLRITHPNEALKYYETKRKHTQDIKG